MSRAPKSTIAKLRKERGLSQQQLAEIVGAHWITISKLERGKLKLTYEWSQRIAEAMNVQVDQIFDVDKPLSYISLPKSIANGGSVRSNKHPLPEDPENVLLIRFDADFFYSSDDAWCSIDTDDFYPMLHFGDLIKLFPIDETLVQDCVGRLCLVKEKSPDGVEMFGILALENNGKLALTRLNGASINIKPFDVVACMTMTLLSPSRLGMPRYASS